MRRLVYLLKNFQNQFMTQIKEFILNGQKYYTEYNINLFELINYFNYNGHLLVVEHNNLICIKRNWKNIFITNQDKIEIVTIVGGG
jgi:thiamine biosynthesis protein ThiS